MAASTIALRVLLRWCTRPCPPLRVDSAIGSRLYTGAVIAHMCNYRTRSVQMILSTAVRVVAVVAVGLLAGIFLGHRAGPQFALHALSPSSFVQFQQLVH